jgi:hypothetical protein
MLDNLLNHILGIDDVPGIHRFIYGGWLVLLETEKLSFPLVAKHGKKVGHHIFFVFGEFVFSLQLFKQALWCMRSQA